MFLIRGFLGNNTVFHHLDRRKQSILPSESIFLWTVSVFFILFAGLCSGLSIGLMSIDPVHLKLAEINGSEREKEEFKLLANVTKEHHLLLVTLLLANTLAMESLPLFLSVLLPPWAVVLTSVTSILFFGEIIPQALCTGSKQLGIARKSASFINVLMVLFLPVAWPIAKFLDYVLGNPAHHYYARGHLKALIKMHERSEERVRSSDPLQIESTDGPALCSDEVHVIEGALDMAGKKISQVMLPLENVFMLEYYTPLNRSTVQLILSLGHSRIPVYKNSRHNIKGLILTKCLLLLDHNSGILAGHMILRKKPIFAHPDTNLYDLLNEFQKVHSHIAFVTAERNIYRECLQKKTDISDDAHILGIVTLEDVIEELIQEEIYDEFDDRGVFRIISENYERLKTNMFREDECYDESKLQSGGACRTPKETFHDVHHNIRITTNHDHDSSRASVKNSADRQETFPNSRDSSLISTRYGHACESGNVDVPYQELT